MTKSKKWAIRNQFGKYDTRSNISIVRSRRVILWCAPFAFGALAFIITSVEVPALAFNLDTTSAPPEVHCSDVAGLSVCEVGWTPDTLPLAGDAPALAGNGKPTQRQKDITAQECRRTFRGDESEISKCYVRLLAVAFKESRFNCRAHNGNEPPDPRTGAARWSDGCFMILNTQGVALADAQDYRKSLRWTIDRMIRYGYKTDPYYAVMRHNGSGPRAEAYRDDVRRIAAGYERQGL